MKRLILILAVVLVTGTAYAGEVVKGEFFVGGGVDPGKVAHTLIKLTDGKYKDCLAHTSGKLSGKRLMLNVDKVVCGDKTLKIKGTVYDEAGTQGIDVTLAVPGQRTVFPGQEVVLKLK